MLRGCICRYMCCPCTSKCVCVRERDFYMHVLDLCMSSCAAVCIRKNPRIPVPLCVIRVAERYGEVGGQRSEEEAPANKANHASAAEYPGPAACLHFWKRFLLLPALSRGNLVPPAPCCLPLWRTWVLPYLSFYLENLSVQTPHFDNLTKRPDGEIIRKKGVQCSTDNPMLGDDLVIS